MPPTRRLHRVEPYVGRDQERIVVGPVDIDDRDVDVPAPAQRRGLARVGHGLEHGHPAFARQHVGEPLGQRGVCADHEHADVGTHLEDVIGSRGARLNRFS